MIVMMDKLFATFGKIVLVVVIIGSIAYGGYYLGNSGKISIGKNPKPEAVTTTNPMPTDGNERPIATVTPTPAKAVAKKIVSAGVAADAGLSFGPYTIQVTDTWNVKHDVDTSVPIDTLTLTSGDYQLKIYQAATGGSKCVYPGDPPFEGPSQLYKEYVTITGATYTYRRSPTDSAVPAGKAGFTLCQKASDGGYGQPTSFGHISYITPIAPNEATLREMDTMVESLSK